MRLPSKFSCALLCGYLLAGAISNAKAVVLVKNNVPTAVIVIDKDASEQVKSAAQLLQSYVRKSTGATLPITNAPGPQSSIFIGTGGQVEKRPVDLEGLDQDGFVLDGAGKRIAIIGGSDWGTEFGVDEFLERYLGVRWLMPTDIGTDIPHHDNLDIPDVHERLQPTFLSRQMSPVDILAGTPIGQWGRSNRARGRVAFHHNLMKLFPVSQYGETHPEFYSVVNGSRHLPANDRDSRWQPNFSAPGIVAAAVSRISQFFQEHPEADAYSLGMNDSNNWDQSPESRKRRSGRQNYLGKEDVSDDYFSWANAVAEGLQAKYPAKLFGTLAYNGLAEPPSRIRVNPHIVPFITYDRMQWDNPALRDAGQKLNARWEAVSPVLGWYDYAYGITYMLPRVYFHRMQQYLSWGAAHHVKYYYAELYPNWGEGPKPWVLTRLLWNPNQDVDKLLDDWYAHFAGTAAAPKLKAYYSLWETFWDNEVSSLKFNSKGGQYLLFAADPSYLADVPTSDLVQSDRLLAQAQELADTPERKARVAKLQTMWSFYRASVVAYQGERATTGANPESSEQAVRLFDTSDASELAAQKRQSLLQEFRSDPLFAGTAEKILLYPATAGRYWGSSTLSALARWIHKSPALQARMAQSTVSSMRQQVPLMLAIKNGNMVLASQNASFEEGTKGWKIWDKAGESAKFQKGKFTVADTIAKSGPHSLSIKGLSRGAVIQTIPYQAGTYLATAHCYVPPGSKFGTVTLSLRVAGSKGAVPLDLPQGVFVLQPGTWASVEVPFKLTARDDPADRLQMIITFDGFAPDGEVFLDDAGIYRVAD